MGFSRNRDDSIPEFRPLPSVEMALLPGDRRVARLRFTLVSSVVVIAIAGAVLVAFVWPDLRRSIKSAKVALPSASALHKKDKPCNPDDRAAVAPAIDTSLSAISSREQRGSQAPAEAAEPVADRNDETEAGDLPAVSDNVPKPTEEERSGRSQTKRSFGNAPGFREALRAAGLSRVEANELVGAFRKVVDFRRCRPEHEFVYERDSDGRIARLDYRVDLLEYFRAERDRQGVMRGRRVQVPVEKRRTAKGGYVSTSLGQSLETAGLAKSFAGIFVEAFEGHIDFRRDARTGDRFKATVDADYLNGNFLRYGTVQALEYVGQRTGTLRAFWYVPKRAKGDYYDAKGRTMQGGWLKTPLRYDYISSRFDRKRKHPVLRRVVPHLGIDYAASPGTAVRAAADGAVSFSGERGANGRLIVISHAGGYETAYAHLSHIAYRIKRGAKVEQRQYIGAVGSSGLSTGPHLHFGVRYQGKFIDPATQLNGPGKPLPTSEMPRFRIIVENLTYELNRIKLSPAPENTGAPLQGPGPELQIEGTESL